MNNRIKKFMNVEIEDNTNKREKYMVNLRRTRKNKIFNKNRNMNFSKPPGNLFNPGNAASFYYTSNQNKLIINTDE